MNKPDITPRLLPVNCYASAKRNLVPAELKNPIGIVQHGISCINVKPDDPYNADLCWQLLHDLNFEPDQRKYSIYTGPRSGASAHFLIARDGEIIQLVPLEYQAWHAGESSFNGMKYCNGFMFGVENIGSDKIAYTDDQYKSNAELSKWLMSEYKIPADYIVGHKDVAPGRKTDPWDTWDWKKYFSLLHE